MSRQLVQTFQIKIEDAAVNVSYLILQVTVDRDLLRTFTVNFAGSSPLDKSDGIHCLLYDFSDADLLLQLLPQFCS